MVPDWQKKYELRMIRGWLKELPDDLVHLAYVAIKSLAQHYEEKKSRQPNG